MKGYFRVPNSVFNLKLTRIELVALIYLYRCSNNSDAFPSHSTIAKNCKMSDRSVARVIKTLESKGLIKVQRHHRKVNHYSVTESHL